LAIASISSRLILSRRIPLAACSHHSSRSPRFSKTSSSLCSR
jgi:hypothetical protein